MYGVSKISSEQNIMLTTFPGAQYSAQSLAEHLDVFAKAGIVVDMICQSAPRGAAVDFIKQFKVDFAVIGTSALDEDGALLDYDFREVRVSQAIIENARKVILVSDRFKLERSAPIRVAHMSQVDIFVTDWLPSERVGQICREHGVEVVETNPGHETTEA